MQKSSEKVWLVIPTIRNLNFLEEWGEQFSSCNLVVVEDSPNKTVEFDQTRFKKTFHYCYQDIANDLGQDEWIIPRKNAGIRNYGFWKAYISGADVIITLDDDCFPTEIDFVAKHLDNLSFSGSPLWATTYPDPNWMYTRGFPYGVRNQIPTKVSHGLWSGALDLDAKTETSLDQLLEEKPYPSIRQPIPFGQYYPMCSMNLAFHRDITPAIFFPMMGYDPDGNSWGYDRYDDIWAGILSKKIMDHLGWGVVNGSPFVEHKKKSDPGANLEKEKTGMRVNEDFWKWVDAVTLTSTTPADCYKELANKIAFPKQEYFIKLKQAMVIWAGLFS